MFVQYYTLHIHLSLHVYLYMHLSLRSTSIAHCDSWWMLNWTCLLVHMPVEERYSITYAWVFTSPRIVAAATYRLTCWKRTVSRLLSCTSRLVQAFFPAASTTIQRHWPPHSTQHMKEIYDAHDKYSDTCERQDKDMQINSQDSNFQRTIAASGGTQTNDLQRFRLKL